MTAANGHTDESACLNCGTPLVGEFCHACGQRAHVHTTIGAFWHDLLHGVLHFEGKTWRTLPLLAWRPGDLSRRYIAGERASFVSPIAIFLFAVFLMFATVSLIGGPFATKPITAEDQQRVQQEYEVNLADGQKELRQLEAQRATLAASGQSTSTVDSAIAELKQGMALQARVYEQVGAVTKVTVEQNSSGEGTGSSAALGADVATPGWFDNAYRKAKQNPSLLFYKLQTNAYKFSWALIPISVPFVWLLFLHRHRYRRFGAYHHTVFATYSIAFMTLGFVVLTLLGAAGVPTRALVYTAILVPPVHMYRQLRGAYSLSRWSAAWRTAALLVLSLLAAILFAAMLLALGVLG